MFNLPTAPDLLADLLERERRIILSGEIDRLPRLLPEKERLLARMHSSVTEVGTAERLRLLADRNQEMLTAVSRGIQSARQKLEALSAPGAALQTYDQGGQKRDMHARATKVEKRA